MRFNLKKLKEKIIKYKNKLNITILTKNDL